MKFEELEQSERKLSEWGRRGVRRLLVAVLAVSGLACVPSARAAVGMGGGVGVGGESAAASRGDLLAGGGGGAGAAGALASPLAGVTAVVSAASMQRLRDVARLD